MTEIITSFAQVNMTELCSQPAMKLAYPNTQNLNPSILISSTTNHSLLDSTWSQYFGYVNRPTRLCLIGPFLFLSHAAQLWRTKTTKWKEQLKTEWSLAEREKLPLQHETRTSYFSILKMSKDFSQVYRQKKWAKSENQRPNQCSQQFIIKVLTVLHVVQWLI